MEVGEPPLPGLPGGPFGPVEEAEELHDVLSVEGLGVEAGELHEDLHGNAAGVVAVVQRADEPGALLGVAPEAGLEPLEHAEHVADELLARQDPLQGACRIRDAVLALEVAGSDSGTFSRLGQIRFRFQADGRR